MTRRYFDPSDETRGRYFINVGLAISGLPVGHRHRRLFYKLCRYRARACGMEAA